MFKVVPFLRVRYGDVDQNGPADDVVAVVATGPFFERYRVNHRIDTDSLITAKLAPSQVDYFCLTDRSVRVKCASDV